MSASPSQVGRLLRGVGLLAALGAVSGVVRVFRSAPVSDARRPAGAEPRPSAGSARPAPSRRPGDEDRAHDDDPARRPPEEDDSGADAGAEGGDRAPGESRESRTDVVAAIRGYVVGLVLAVALTAASFFVASGGSVVWGPAVPVALVVLAIAQMGVHLVFFLHITTGPDNTNNVLALAFGTLIVILLIGGSLWIMANLDANMLPMDEIMRRQR